IAERGQSLSRAGYNQYGFGQHTRTLGDVQALYVQLGKTVRRLRLKLGWTQDVMADRSGLHRAHIGEIERGQTNVTLQTLKTLADALNVRITDLLKGL
ncbi:MAG: helix-turn-helix transcriptional regulator, partial [Planctomycetes bacterium]|nr:helix-turn-helix transcriptional regulator [Planctomycetota bacterium]